MLTHPPPAASSVFACCCCYGVVVACSAGDLGTFSQTISYGAFDFDFAVDLLEYIMAKCWTQVRTEVRDPHSLTGKQAGRHTRMLHMAAAGS